MTDTADRAMAGYYARRAAEYEQVYRKPERQADPRVLTELLGTAFAGHDVLEVACGTGYWTEVIARSARSIVAADINGEVLAIARTKDYGACRVTLTQADAYAPPSAAAGFTAGFHAFWWSHVSVQRIDSFLDAFHSALMPGALVVMMDNTFVEGSSTPVSRRDEDGNTYQVRRLRDGSTHEVLKNFPAPEALRANLALHADGMQITQLQYYWLAQYRKKG